jgi:HAD superfamily hydrolase (TIGR01509 family)
MIKAILSDFSYVLLFPKEKSYSGTLNGLYSKLLQQRSYNYFDYYQLNEELIQAYQKYRKPGFSVNIYTSGTVQEDPQVKEKITPYFDNIFSAEKSNMSKENKDSYIKVASLLKLQPKEIVFIDDQDRFINGAKQAGLNIIKYKNNSDTINKLHSLL